MEYFCYYPVMARPRKSDPVLSAENLAIAELRSRLQMTQQDFAVALGMSINTIARFETGREPNSKSLAALSTFARANRQFDLARIFESTLFTRLGLVGTEGQIEPETLRVVAKYGKNFLAPKIAAALQRRYWEKIGSDLDKDLLNSAGLELLGARQIIDELYISVESGQSVPSDVLSDHLYSLSQHIEKSVELILKKMEELKP